MSEEALRALPSDSHNPFEKGLTPNFIAAKLSFAEEKMGIISKLEKGSRRNVLGDGLEVEPLRFLRRKIKCM